MRDLADSINHQFLLLLVKDGLLSKKCSYCRKKLFQNLSLVAAGIYDFGGQQENPVRPHLLLSWDSHTLLVSAFEKRPLAFSPGSRCVNGLFLGIQV